MNLSTLLSYLIPTLGKTMKTEAKIIADSINHEGARITTFQVTAPRFLLAEVNTHRIIAKSAASSRAIPVEKRIAMTINEPFIPSAFGKNKPGMQADELLSEDANNEATALWKAAAASAAQFAKALSQVGAHKQHANRLLEPFVYYMGVMTATEWDAFWELRLHPDAQPEFQELAKLMREAYDTSRPRVTRFHLPYTDDCADLDLERSLKVSAARCARVSYKTFDGKASTVEKDIELCADLIAGGHLSPFDHQGITDVTYSEYHAESNTTRRFWENPEDHRQFWGWIPYRVQVENALGWKGARRNSYDPLP